MLSEDFYRIFQQKYSIINEYEKRRYKLEYDLYTFKTKPMLSPLITFTQKTFPWPNPQYELDDQVSYHNTLVLMDQYIIDVQEIIVSLDKDLSIIKDLNLYK
jgi:hypothetical protein